MEGIFTPPDGTAVNHPNLTRAILANADARGGQPCLRFFRDGGWRDLSWREVGERVAAYARGLATLGRRPGERIAIISGNRPEWALADLAGLAAGTQVVGVYATLPDADMAFILRHAACRTAFVETPELAARLSALRPQLPALEQIITLSGSSEARAGVLDLPALAAKAEGRGPLPGCAAGGDDAALVIYTSGTTGEPKGVILTHRNILATLAAVAAAFGDVSRLRLNLSFLPLAHALERIAGHFLPLVQGHTIAYARSLDTVADDFRAVRPDFAVAVPRVFEKIYARIHAQVQAKPAAAQALFRWAVQAGTRRSQYLERGQMVPSALAVRWAVADLLIFRAIRARLGGRLRFFVSGGAPLSAAIARFFHAAGILVCEGWGATETSAPSTWNTPSAYRFGSVGRALPGVEVRLAADAELEVRGFNVFLGYLDNPAATAEAFTPDGFWRSGDIGRRDDDGFFYITDRKKELIVTAGGKNIAPQKLENLLREQPFISHCLVHGDRRPYVVALLTVDRATLAAAHPELAQAPLEDERLQQLLAVQVEEVNRQLARFEQIKAFRVLESDFTVESGELSQSMKLKRRVVEERYRHLLDDMYLREKG